MRKYYKNKIGAPVGVKCGDRKNLMLNFVPKARFDELELRNQLSEILSEQDERCLDMDFDEAFESRQRD